MVQGSKKLSSRPGLKNVATSAKVNQKIMKLKKKAKKGNPLQLPRSGKFRDEAIDDRNLSKAIDKASESKVAAKLVQGGGKIKIKEIMQQGKEINKDLRRSMVKKKVGRVEEKLNKLKEKSMMDGKVSLK